MEYSIYQLLWLFLIYSFLGWLGETALVTETVDNQQAKGQVRVDGQIWSARSAHDVVIPVGTEVRVLRIEGVKVIVETQA